MGFGAEKKEGERAGLPLRSVIRWANGFRDVAAPAACSRDPLVRRRCRPGRPALAVRPAARQFANTTTRELSRTKLYDPPRTEWIR